MGRVPDDQRPQDARQRSGTWDAEGHGDGCAVHEVFEKIDAGGEGGVGGRLVHPTALMAPPVAPVLPKILRWNNEAIGKRSTARMWGHDR